MKISKKKNQNSLILARLRKNKRNPCKRTCRRLNLLQIGNRYLDTFQEGIEVKMQSEN